MGGQQAEEVGSFAWLWLSQDSGAPSQAGHSTASWDGPSRPLAKAWGPETPGPLSNTRLKMRGEHWRKAELWRGPGCINTVLSPSRLPGFCLMGVTEWRDNGVATGDLWWPRQSVISFLCLNKCPEAMALATVGQKVNYWINSTANKRASLLGVFLFFVCFFELVRRGRKAHGVRKRAHVHSEGSLEVKPLVNCKYSELGSDTFETVFFTFRKSMWWPKLHALISVSAVQGSNPWYGHLLKKMK